MLLADRRRDGRGQVGALSPWHWIIILAVLAVVIGAVVAVVVVVAAKGSGKPKPQAPLDFTPDGRPIYPGYPGGWPPANPEGPPPPHMR